MLGREVLAAGSTGRSVDTLTWWLWLLIGFLAVVVLAIGEIVGRRTHSRAAGLVMAVVAGTECYVTFVAVLLVTGY